MFCTDDKMRSAQAARNPKLSSDWRASGPSRLPERGPQGNNIVLVNPIQVVWCSDRLIVFSGGR